MANAWTYGCTGVSFFWRLFFRKGPPWEKCCFAHDKSYERGGSQFLRLLNDYRLRICVRKSGHHWWAEAHWLAVLVLGWTAWKWKWVRSKIRFSKN